MTSSTFRSIDDRLVVPVNIDMTPDRHDTVTHTWQMVLLWWIVLKARSFCRPWNAQICTYDQYYCGTQQPAIRQSSDSCENSAVQSRERVTRTAEGARILATMQLLATGDSKHFGTVMICQYRHLKPAYWLKITINLNVSNVTLNVITVWGTGLLDSHDVSGIRFLTRHFIEAHAHKHLFLSLNKQKLFNNNSTEQSPSWQAKNILSY